MSVRVAGPTLAIVVLIATGCSSNPVRQSARTQGEALKEQQRSAITERGDLSLHSARVYRTLALESEFERSPEHALRALEAKTGGVVSAVDRGLAIAETCYLLADAGAPVDEAMRLFLRSVSTSLDVLQGHADLFSLLDPRMALVGELYNRALARFLVLVQDDEESASRLVDQLETHPNSVRIDRGPGLLDPRAFDRLIPTDSVRLVGIPNRQRRFGVGVTLIGVRQNVEGEDRIEPLRPPLIVDPVTVLADSDEAGALRLRFVDPRVTPSLPGRDGRVVPIAADFTSPLAWQVANSKLYTLEDPSLFDPATVEAQTGVYFFEPYDPKKIPLILVHGLWSSPLTWIWLANEVWGDEVLRERYQVWFYAYPTGLPILVNAARFRRELLEARAKIDPEGDDAATRGVVLVGHSMGGLLSKHLVKEIGSSLWDVRMKRPFDTVKAAPDDRDLLYRAFFHEPLPWVERVVFMATPHRGSSLAEGLVGAIGNALITLPPDLVAAVERMTTDNPGIVKASDALGEGPITSIRGLRSDSPLLAALEAAPWRTGLPFHSIIGDEEGADRTGGSDGVVPYRSSHLDGARSELVVESDHSVTKKPAAMVEVRRILHLHLAERGP